MLRPQPDRRQPVSVPDRELGVAALLLLLSVLLTTVLVPGLV